MRDINIYNTLTKKVDKFVPNEPGKIKMYTCGPTVYHFAHIGNLRSYIEEDILEKYLRYAGYDVKRVKHLILTAVILQVTLTAVRIRCLKVPRESTRQLWKLQSFTGTLFSVIVKS